MEKFVKLTGVAAPLMRPNVDTDVIIPIRRLVMEDRGQIGAYAFEPWRYLDDGSDNPDFVWNDPAYRGAPILIAGRNFGCGSSREGAVWALWQSGVRVVIAPGFGDIFFNNCFKNGLLAIVLAAETVDALAAQTAAGRFTVDLETLRLTAPDGAGIAFEVDPLQRDALLQGLDEIAMTLRRGDEIAAFQATDRGRRPWIYQIGGA